MPELPEVEATCSYLRERVVQETIIESTCLWERTIATHTAKKFAKIIRGSVIKQILRRGKFIVLELVGEKSRYLFIHLRMSGSLDVISNTQPLAVHDRTILTLSNKQDIRFHDVRKFGRLYLYDNMEAVSQKLGVEPLSQEFTPQHLQTLLSHRKTPIKPLLLNQSIIAGLGNIYVDESLWKAKIHPQQQASTISKRKVGALHTAIISTLQEAITLLGTDFGDNVVHGGMYTPQVYGRTAKPCLRCSSPVTRIVVGQRGTHLCKRCQRLP
jgi:formamidopyrimidine-DNA glycosylase